MTPEATRFLDKARQLLARADTMLSAGLTDDAGRTAYLAGFHAAQALIFEHRGKAAKTHRGVQAEFLRLTKDDARLDPQLRAFLSSSYNLKSIADYETGPNSHVSAERAREATQTAHRFVPSVASLIPANGDTPRTEDVDLEPDNRGDVTAKGRREL